jgi:hypothetical protein
LSVLCGLIEVVIVGLAANELGGFLAKLFFKNKRLFADIVLDEISRLALGLVGISYALLLLVAVRVVYSGVLWGFLFLLALLALLRLKRLFHELPSRPSPYVFFKEPEFLFLVLYLALMVFLTALPASARDELVYHLEVPRSLLAAHGEVLFRDNIYAYFPKFTEMFFLFGLGTFGEAAAKMFHLLFGVLTVFGLCRVALGWLGRIQARWAAALFLGIPSVMTVMPVAYVDLAFAFFAFMALLHVLTYCREKILRHAVLAGIFLGAAIGVKYTGLQLSALVLCVLATAKLKDRTLPIILPAAIIAGLSLALALPYFFRNLQLTGWPMFPFALPGFHLKTGLNWDPERARLFLKYLQSFGAWPGPSGILQALLAPAGVFILGQFNQLSFYDGMVGPVFLLIPFLIFRKKMTSELQLAGWFVLFYIFYWSVTTRQVRFLLPVMPFLCLFLAWGLKEHRKKGLTVLVGLLLAFNIFCGLREISKKDPLSYWFGKKSREAYLREQVPAYAVYSLANSLLRADDKLYLVHMKNYGYYLDRNWEADFVFERYRLEALLSLNPAAEDVERFFKEKHVNHLMINLAPITDPLRGLDEKGREAFFRFLKQKTQALVSQGECGIFRLN